jgi:uncharacterized phage infection (PIP) family protein YhgE
MDKYGFVQMLGWGVIVGNSYFTLFYMDAHWSKLLAWWGVVVFAVTSLIYAKVPLVKDRKGGKN